MWVIASTSDEASKIEDFIESSKAWMSNYQPIHLHARNRFICFVSESSQLVKTARNSLYHNGERKQTRYLWNGGNTSCSNI